MKIFLLGYEMSQADWALVNTGLTEYQTVKVLWDSTASMYEVLAELSTNVHSAVQGSSFFFHFSVSSFQCLFFFLYQFAYPEWNSDVPYLNINLMVRFEMWFQKLFVWSGARAFLNRTHKEVWAEIPSHFFST